MQIGRHAKEHVRRHKEHGCEVLVKDIQVTGVNVVLDLVVHEVGPRKVARAHEREKRHHAWVVPKGEHDAHGAANLPRAIANSIKRAGRNAPHALEGAGVNAILEKDVENTGRENAPVAAALEHEGGLVAAAHRPPPNTYRHAAARRTTPQLYRSSEPHCGARRRRDW